METNVETNETLIDRSSERFIVDYGTPDHIPASMVNLDELAPLLTRDIEASTYGYTEPPTVFRYVPGSPPRLEPLTLTCVQPEQYDEDDWAHPVWELTGPADKTGLAEQTWATLRLRIDGRV